MKLGFGFLMVLGLHVTLATAQLKFEAQELSMPLTTDADTVPKTLVYRFRQSASMPLRILCVKADCPCTQVGYSPTRVLPPGSKDSIVVSYKPRRVPGIIEERIGISLATDTDTLQTFCFLRGEVTASPAMRWSHLPVIMGSLCLKRNKITTDGTEVIRILCANTAKEPLTLRYDTPHYLSVRTEPSPIPAETEADLVITIDRQTLPSTRPLCSAIRILNWKDNSHIQLTIE